MRWSQILAQNRDFCLPYLQSTPSLRGSLSEYRHDVWCGKTRVEWLPDSEKFWRYAYSFWQNSRTWRTNRQTDGRHRPRLHSIVRQKCFYVSYSCHVSRFTYYNFFQRHYYNKTLLKFPPSNNLQKIVTMLFFWCSALIFSQCTQVSLRIILCTLK